MQNPINPYGKAKKMAEDIILDFTKSKKSNMAVMILRFVFRSPYRIESME
jgi:UDP-arabinose 4-epimerase